MNVIRSGMRVREVMLQAYGLTEAIAPCGDYNGVVFFQHALLEDAIERTHHHLQHQHQTAEEEAAAT
jgi:hypothetical protein